MTKLIVVDLETTGFSPESKKGNRAGLTEITALMYDEHGNFIQPIANSLCRPSGPQYIPKVIEDLTKISWDMVAHMHPDTYIIREMMTNSLKYGGEVPILVAHNAKFEKLWLKYYDNRFGGFRYIDTMAMTMFHKDGNFENNFTKNHHKLQQACKMFGIDYDPNDAHRAEYDVVKTALVVKEFIRIYGLKVCLEVSEAYMNGKSYGKPKQMTMEEVWEQM